MSSCPERLIVAGQYGDHDLGQCAKDEFHDGKHRLWGSGLRRDDNSLYFYWLEWDETGEVKWSLAE